MRGASTTTGLIAVAAMFGYACDALECDESTIEIDGRCVAGLEPDPSSCGAGTHFDTATGQCVSDYGPVECGPNTTPEQQPDGTIICVGEGVVGCEAPIACPAPDGGKVSLCGQLHDMGSGAMIRAPDATGAACDPFAPTTDGPCALGIGSGDPVAFYNDPTNPVQLPVDELYVDDCGRFRIDNTERPDIGYVGVAVDDMTDAGDLTGTPIQDLYLPTGMVVQVDGGQTVRGLRVAATLRATDASWTASAGDPFGGMTFAEVGAYVGVFLHGDTPVSGVTLTGSGATRPDDDFYFADADTGGVKLTVEAARAATGPNGAGLFVDSVLGLHSGTGGEPAGCEWAAHLGGTVAGGILYQENRAHVAGDPDTPCP